MHLPFTTDEQALWQAIVAAPADDAPWLVYADWLQDCGRDREAATVRRFLPDIRAELAAGMGVPAVQELVARQDPGGSGWGLESPPAGPALAVQRRAPLTVTSAAPDGRGRDRGVGGWLAVVLVVKVLVL